MPWCPKCETEYESGVSCCEKCGEPFTKNISSLQIMLVAPIVLIATPILLPLYRFVTYVAFWSSGRLEFAMLPAAYICLAAFGFGIILPSWALWVCWLESAFLLLILIGANGLKSPTFLVLIVMPLPLIIAATRYGSLFRQKENRVSALGKLAVLWALPSLAIYLLYPLIELPFVF